MKTRADAISYSNFWDRFYEFDSGGTLGQLFGPGATLAAPVISGAAFFRATARVGSYLVRVLDQVPFFALPPSS